MPSLGGSGSYGGDDPTGGASIPSGGYSSTGGNGGNDYSAYASLNTDTKTNLSISEAKNNLNKAIDAAGHSDAIGGVIGGAFGLMSGGLLSGVLGTMNGAKIGDAVDRAIVSISKNFSAENIKNVLGLNDSDAASLSSSISQMDDGQKSQLFRATDSALTSGTYSGGFTEEDLLDQALAGHLDQIGMVNQEKPSGAVGMLVDGYLEDYVFEHPEYQDSYDGLLARGLSSSGNRGQMHKDIASYLDNGYLPQNDSWQRQELGLADPDGYWNTQNNGGTEVTTNNSLATVPDNVQTGLDQYVTDTQAATDAYNVKAQALWNDYLDFESTYFDKNEQVLTNYNENIASIPALNLQMPTSMGGAVVPMAATNNTKVYGNQASTQSDIINQQANTALAGLTNRSGLAQNMYGVDSTQATNSLLPTNTALDLYKMERAGELGISQVEAGKADEPSAWTTWAPVVGGLLSTDDNGDSAVDELISVIGGLW